MLLKMTDSQKNDFNVVKSLSMFFSIDLSIKLFGKEIVSFHFPPKKDKID